MICFSRSECEDIIALVGFLSASLRPDMVNYYEVFNSLSLVTIFLVEDNHARHGLQCSKTTVGLDLSLRPNGFKYIPPQHRTSRSAMNHFLHIAPLEAQLGVRQMIVLVARRNDKLV